MPLRVIQIGISHEHANGKIDTLLALKDDYEVIGIVDDRDSTAPRWPLLRADAALHGLPRLSLRQALAIPNLDAAFVEVTNSELVGVAERVLRRRLPMHMDKPGGETYAPFARLRTSAKDLGLPFQMGYMFRGNPAMRWIVNAVREGWLGDIFEIAADMDHGYGDDDYRRYLGSFRGGILYNLGCHFADFVVELLGEPDDVHSFIKTAPGSPMGSRDNGMAVLEWESGAFATIRACGRKVAGGGRRLRVTGTLGGVELCPVERFDGRPLYLNVHLSRPCGGLPAGRHHLNFGVQGRNSNVDRYIVQLREFARQVRGEESEPDSLCAHDLAVHRTVLRMSGIEP